MGPSGLLLLLPVLALSGTLEEDPALDDEAFEIGAEHYPFYESAEWTKRGVKRDAVNHHRSSARGTKLVLVMEPAERTPSLLVDESLRSFECRGCP